MTGGKRFLCSIFGFYLTVALIVPQLLGSFLGFYCMENRLVETFCSADAAKEALKDVHEELISSAQISGLSGNICKNVFTVEQMQDLMAQALHCTLKKETFEPNMDENMAQLQKNIENELLQNEEIDDLKQYKYSIKRFCNQEEFAVKKLLQMDGYKRLKEVGQRILNYLLTALAIAVAVGGICLFFIYRCTRHGGAFLREISFSLIAAGGANAIFAHFAAQTTLLERLNISPAYFLDAICVFFRKGLVFNTYVAAGTAAFGAVLFLTAAVWIALTRKR